MNHRSGDFLEVVEFFVWQFLTHIASEGTGQRFSRSTSVDEDQSLAAGGHDVCYEPRKVIFLSTDFLNCLVREVNETIVVHALLQRHRPPLTFDVFRLKPPRELLRILDRRAQGEDLGPGVHLSQLGEGDLERRSTVCVVDQVNLVRDDDGKPLQPVRLVSEEAVGALGGCDDDVEAFEVWVNRIVVSHAHADLESERLELLQVLVLLRREGPQRNNVEGLPTAEDRCEDREIRHE